MLKPQTKTQLREMIKRKLGAPMVKVELCDDQINDHIDYSISEYIKWATSNATEIAYFTIPLRSGRRYYDLPKDVIDIISYSEEGIGEGGINTLFTMKNYLYNKGMFDPLTAYPQSLLGYYMVNDFLETLEKFQPDQYSWKYHRMTNQLEITPTPKYGKKSVTIRRPNENNIVTEYVLDSPGYVLIKANVIQGATLPNVIRGWDNVIKEIKSGSETRIIKQEEADNTFFALTNNAINQELTIYKNGVEYTNWNWADDNGKMIQWTLPDEILLNDELLLKYNTIIISSDNNNSSMIKEPITITQTVNITPIELATKNILLSEKTVNKNDVEITFNNTKYLYGIDFIIESDDQTINFSNKSLDGLLINGDVISIKFDGLNSTIKEFPEELYGRPWIIDRVTALSKITLGMIRRKFAQFSSIGNSGISLDGDALVSEGKEEYDKLTNDLYINETYEGGYICMG